MIRHGKSIRLTAKEKAAFAAHTGNPVGPTTVDSFNLQMEASAQAWDTCDTKEERYDLLEVLDDRVATRSTVITSQLPVEHWQAYLNDPTLADAILDPVLHSAHKVAVAGESLRKSEKAKP